MAAPIDLNIAQPLMANVAQLPINGGAAAQTVSYRQQAVPAKDVQERVSSQDTVMLSSEALDMSKDLQKKRYIQLDQSEVDKNNSDQKSPNKVAVSVSTIKHFPPFMGDSESLMQIKQTSPALYREILKMMVPPPVNISYLDTLELRNTDPAYRR